MNSASGQSAPITDPLLVETRHCANGKSIGILTLNAPRALNALSGGMARALLQQLRAWRDDTDIACLVLQGAGEKAFCAGGDVVAMHRSLVRADANTEREIEEYFTLEYTLDYALHTYQKPILCWGHGIVMGGGLGMLVGASHRVVTEASRLAMPEITIGLYPDVGASWFLNRMPGRSGLFIGLTGVPLNAADALFLRLADYFLPHEENASVLDALQQLSWDESPQENRRLLSALLRQRRHLLPAPSPVREHLDVINSVADQDTVEEFARALVAAQTQSPWLQRAAQTFQAGSPSSEKVIFETYRRAAQLSLKEAFALELGLTIQFTRRPDLREGVRALLIDKDNQPRWSPATLAQVSARDVDAYFASPWAKDRHPFRDW